ncbi:helix-turn-helix domain-containing protein [Streptomyces sp. HPF1205]|uniref:AraC-like ligand-binding domain-containing protein n=1 Tax=Streptomyces sp. HPF1205 TaxID=2873262 RepID=UPI001CED4203|nr:helix-turn-helix domain-containing protein [Streptomyces sp. HPF1205]
MTPIASPPEEDRFAGSLLTTAAVPAGRRREYWREALSRTFGAVDMSVPEEVTAGTIRTAALGGLRATRVDGDPLEARRTRRLIARGDEDGFVVVKLLSKGVARIEQDAREVGVNPGEVFIYDMARPLRLVLPECFQTKSLVLPREALGLDESDLSRITASPFRSDTAPGALLSVLVSQLADTAGSYRPGTAELLARKAADLVTVLAEERLGRASGRTEGRDEAMRLRIRAFIGRNLADPGLTPQTLARAHHISVRYLHKIFEAEDTTVSRLIRSRRLEACRQDLIRRENANRTIVAVARQWGFTSASHFSRVFLAAYGMSPGEWRAAHRP